MPRYILVIALLALALAACVAEIPGNPAPQTILTPEQAAPGEQPRVVIYTLANCPHCRAAKAFMTENQIPFDEREVGNNRGHLAELSAIFAEMGVAKAAQGVPLLVVDGKTRLQGFDKVKLGKALAPAAR